MPDDQIDRSRTLAAPVALLVHHADAVALLDKIIADRFALQDAPPRKGGMAEIYRAADTADKLKPVAVKFMTRTRIHDDRILREAFNRELCALNALDHPNIVRIIDFDPRYDPPYMVLEWLDRDLTSYLASTPLSGWSDFYVRIGRPVLLALSYALTKRIVHRDLKPGNILLDDNGVPKVADFGISKFYDQAAGGLTLAAFKSEPYALTPGWPAPDASLPRCRTPDCWPRNRHISSPRVTLSVWYNHRDCADLAQRVSTSH